MPKIQMTLMIRKQTLKNLSFANRLEYLAIEGELPVSAGWLDKLPTKQLGVLCQSTSKLLNTAAGIPTAATVIAGPVGLRVMEIVTADKCVSQAKVGVLCD